MFIGHFAVGLAAKRVAPKTSLGTLFIGAQLLDLLWPIFVLTGIEHFRIAPGNTAMTPLQFYDYPISHSLLTSIVWAALAGGVYFFIRRETRAAVVIGLCVVSHWFLDYLTHRPDLPITPGSASYYGLGLWNSFWPALAVEVLMFGAGILVYVKSTRAMNRKGSTVFWSLMGFLLVVHLLNVFGPPPPNVQVVAISANAVWLLIVWAYWADGNRAPLM